MREKFVISVSFLLLLCFMLPGSVRADTFTYTYTGDLFTQFSLSGQCPSECKITGSFTVPTRLTGGMSLQSVSPVSFVFSDGNNNITSGDEDPTALQFRIATNRRGNIDGWYIVLEDLSHDLEMQTLNAPAFDLNVRDLTAAAGEYQAENMNSPGTWSPSAVPEPSSLMLFVTGLLGLLVLATQTHPQN
jgi:hypothetical protein